MFRPQYSPTLNPGKASTKTRKKMYVMLSPNLITVKTAIAKAKMEWNRTSTTEIPHAASIYDEMFCK